MLVDAATGDTLARGAAVGAIAAFGSYRKPLPS